MNTPKTPSVPTLSTPTAPTLPASRNGKAADIKKAEFLSAIRAAFDGWNKGRDTYKAAVEKAQKALDGRVSTLTGAVRAAKDSGLFTDAELIEAVKAMAIESGYTPQAASYALIAAGLRQRAPRKPREEKPEVESEKSEETATPATPAAAEMSADPMEFAAQLAAKMGKKEAMKFLSVAFQSLAIA